MLPWALSFVRSTQYPSWTRPRIDISQLPTLRDRCRRVGFPPAAPAARVAAGRSNRIRRRGWRSRAGLLVRFLDQPGCGVAVSAPSCVRQIVIRSCSARRTGSSLRASSMLFTGSSSPSQISGLRTSLAPFAHSFPAGRRPRAARRDVGACDGDRCGDIAATIGQHPLDRDRS